MISLIQSTLLFLAFTGLGMPTKESPDRDIELVNQVLSTSVKIIQKKHNLRACGAGVSMPGGPIRELTLSFSSNKLFLKEELRKILISAAHEMVQLVNNNKEIQQYLFQALFTEKNVQIIIFNHDANGRGVFDPEIAVAEISKGTLAYATEDSQNTFGYKNEFTETYEEALRAINE